MLSGLHPTVLIKLLHTATATPRVLISIIPFFGSNNPKTIGHALLPFFTSVTLGVRKKKSRMMFLHFELMNRLMQIKKEKTALSDVTDRQLKLNKKRIVQCVCVRVCVLNFIVAKTLFITT